MNRVSQYYYYYYYVCLVYLFPFPQLNERDAVKIIVRVIYFEFSPDRFLMTSLSVVFFSVCFFNYLTRTMATIL